MKKIIAVVTRAAAARPATAPAHSNPYAPDRLRITRGRGAVIKVVSCPATSRSSSPGGAWPSSRPTSMDASRPSARYSRPLRPGPAPPPPALPSSTTPPSGSPSIRPPLRPLDHGEASSSPWRLAGHGAGRGDQRPSRIKNRGNIVGGGIYNITGTGAQDALRGPRDRTVLGQHRPRAEHA